MNKKSVIISVIILFIVIAVIIGIQFSTHWQRKSYINQDKENIMSLFHIPSEVVLVSFFSAPQSSSTFGREGLHIYAIFKFSDIQFSKYLKIITDSNNWRPVPFIGRTPEIDKQFTQKSCEWKNLPLPSYIWTGDNNEKLFVLEDKMKAIEEGMYYCTISYMRYDHPPIYSKRYSCKEAQERPEDPLESKYGFARIIGVLDSKNKILYVEYRM